MHVPYPLIATNAQQLRSRYAPRALAPKNMERSGRFTARLPEYINLNYVYIDLKYSDVILIRLVYSFCGGNKVVGLNFQLLVRVGPSYANPTCLAVLPRTSPTYCPCPWEISSHEGPSWVGYIAHGELPQKASNHGPVHRNFESRRRFLGGPLDRSWKAATKASIRGAMRTLRAQGQRKQTTKHIL